MAAMTAYSLKLVKEKQKMPKQPKKRRRVQGKPSGDIQKQDTAQR
jgi:hypothetical protein